MFETKLCRRASGRAHSSGTFPQNICFHGLRKAGATSGPAAASGAGLSGAPAGRAGPGAPAVVYACHAALTSTRRAGFPAYPAFR